jgi:hypothetical protein
MAMLTTRTLTGLLAILVSGLAFAADPTFPPGSRIGLVPPADMILSEGIAGFRDPKTGAGIATIEMPADAYPSIVSSFADESLKQQGFTLKARETVKIGNTEAMIISGEQGKDGAAIPKSLLLATEGGMTVLVVAQSPVGASTADQEKLRQVLKTVVFRPALTMEQQIASLPFRLGQLAGFRPVRVMAGNSILLTDGPNDAVKQAEQPIMIVAQSVSPPPPSEQRDAFARQLLVSNTFLTEPSLERSQGFRQDGNEWHEIVAKAKDGHSGVPVIVLQTIRFSPGGYLRMVGVVKAEDRDAVMPRMRQLVDAVAPK